MLAQVADARYGGAVIRAAFHRFFCGRETERSAGFSLLEMMVALAVFSIAALALIKLQGASVSQAAELDNRLYSEIVARNLAVEKLTDPRAPALGSTSGEVTNYGRSFNWRTETRQLDGSEILRVDIAVSQGLGPDVTLTILKGAL